jgi:hypothetical protein
VPPGPIWYTPCGTHEHGTWNMERSRMSYSYFGAVSCSMSELELAAGIWYIWYLVC